MKYAVYTKEQFNETFDFWKSGMPVLRISKKLNIPRSTIKTWINLWTQKNSISGDELTKKTSSSLLISLEEILSCLNKESYSYVLGMYLGDGHIVKEPRTWKLRIFQDSKYQNLINYQMKMISDIFPNNTVLKQYHGGVTCTEIYVYSNNIEKLFPQHGPGKKHLRKIELQNWQKDICYSFPEQFVKGLFDSDGCSYLSKGVLYYSFSNMSIDIKNLLKTYLIQLGIHFSDSGSIVYNEHGIKHHKNISVYRKADVAKLANIIPRKS